MAQPELLRRTLETVTAVRRPFGRGLRHWPIGSHTHSGYNTTVASAPATVVGLFP